MSFPKLNAPVFHEPITDKMGKIQLILGPMFSGKTTELIRRIRRYEYANYRCMIVRYEKDVRYDDDQLSTHNREKIKAISAVALTTLIPMTSEIDVIAIDEGQFFPDIVSFAETMANSRKIILVAALDGTFERKGFTNILNLIPLAESVEKINAVCMSCFRDAAFTKRIGQEKEVELIGGSEKYMSVCRECHKLEAPVKRSPFKKLEPAFEHNGTTTASSVNEKKRKLFEGDENSKQGETKSLKQTQV
uniref:Thymidine kinase n=1 Tax=Cacopsylla melanoneura TaxID=428564 RepID=A0A8D8X9L9_9HEMI